MHSAPPPAPRHLLNQLRSLCREGQLLLFTQLLFNVGFYLVVPFIAPHLSQDLLVDGALIGLVLGLRTFSQQGLFFLGGALADRCGVRPVLLVGILIRIAGFCCAGAAHSLPLFIAGVLLIGVGAALFSPAVDARLAQLDAAERGLLSRRELFALDSMFLNLGSVLGPLCGALLIGLGFARVSALGAALFAVIFCAHALLAWHARRGALVTPEVALDAPAAAEPLWAGMGRALSSRRFWFVALLGSVVQASYHLQYLALPAEFTRLGFSAAAVGWIFALISLFTVLAQMPLTKLSQRVSPPRIFLLGFGLQALAFGLMALAAPQPRGVGASLVPVVVFVLLLHGGQMLLSPLIRETMVQVAGGRDVGAHLGALSSVGGLLVLLLSITVGRLFDAAMQPTPAAALPWAALAALSLLALAAAATWKRAAFKCGG